MIFSWAFLSMCLAMLGKSQPLPECGPMTTSSTSFPPVPCNILYTASVPPQIGPTSTIWETVATTRFNVVNCELCSITNIAVNAVPTGPFTTRVTSPYLLIPEIACIQPSTIGDLRRGLTPATVQPTQLIVRGAKPQTFSSILRRNGMVIPSVANLLKRQASQTGEMGSFLNLFGEPLRICRQLFTLLFSIGVINSGQDLGAACLQLNSANAFLDLASLGLNSTQAGAIVCEASQNGGDLSAYNSTLFNVVSAGLYAVQITSNFTGTTNPRELCTRLDLSRLTQFGIDVASIQSIICGAGNTTSSPFPSVEASANASSTLSASNDSSTVTDAIETVGNVTILTTSARFPAGNTTAVLSGPTTGFESSSSENGISAFTTDLIESSTISSEPTGERDSRSAGSDGLSGSTQVTSTGDAPFGNATSSSQSDFTGTAISAVGTGAMERSGLDFSSRENTSLSTTGPMINTAESPGFTLGSAGDFPFPNATAAAESAATLVSSFIVVSTVDFSTGNTSLANEVTSSVEIGTGATGNLPLVNATSATEFSGFNASSTSVTLESLSGNVTSTTESGPSPSANLTSTPDSFANEVNATTIDSAATKTAERNVTASVQRSGNPGDEFTTSSIRESSPASILSTSQVGQNGGPVGYSNVVPSAGLIAPLLAESTPSQGYARLEAPSHSARGPQSTPRYYAGYV